MECLGLIKIHSPMRANFRRVIKWLPTQNIISAARIACEKILRRIGAGTSDPFGACSIVKKRVKGKSPHIPHLRENAIKHQRYVKGATMYPLERNIGNGILCMVPNMN
ncbi:sialyltransferase-like protein 2 [Canna indica]|uniref:Sialyltransferase-like protein 2 n=1 Tax=Canna indica TaxID=4628 RepID=A0AAQ3QQN5_9LILI|nr:sialyltransferase-like protein 2 [Canna indica]